MTEHIHFTLDGKEIHAEQGQTILQAAEIAGVYIPRLCAHPELVTHGSCRLCTVKVNGRAMAACTSPAMEGSNVENDSDEIRDIRLSILEMLFVEGNHVCPACEKSGNCELQAIAYRLGMDTIDYPFLNPVREVDGSHDEVLIDRNRCVQCGRCVRASVEIDGKEVFAFAGRGIERHVIVGNGLDLGDSSLEKLDTACEVCPVGAILPRGRGFSTPIGQRDYDFEPIGTGCEE